MTNKELQTQKIAVIGKIYSENGVAIYTEHLYENIEHLFEQFYYLSNKDISDRVHPDKENILRTWSSGEKDFSETLKCIDEKNIDLVHIQYHSQADFQIEALDLLITELKKRDKKVYVTLHAVYAQSFDFIKVSNSLELCDKVFVHNKNDFEHASKKLKNLVLFQIPIKAFKERNKIDIRKDLGLSEFTPIIASHGLMNINKNIPDVIKAIKILKAEYENILFLSINAVTPNNLHSYGQYEISTQLTKELGLESNIYFVKDFLNENQIEVLLQAADINVLAYSEIGESASDAVRKCLASKNPTIVTDIKMFSEFTNEVFKVKTNSPEDIASAVNFLLNDNNKFKEIINSTEIFLRDFRFDNKSEEMLSYY